MNNNEAPIHVLVVTTYYYPQSGGVANHTYNLYREVVKDPQYTVTVVASSLDKTTYSKDEQEGISVYRLPYLFTLSNTPMDPRWVRRMREIVTQEQPDVIAIHTPVPFLADCAAFAAGDIPIVLKYHHAGSMAKGIWWIDPFLKLYEATLFRKLIDKSKVVLTASDFTRRTFFKNDLEKTRVITPGVDVERFAHNKKSFDKKLLFVANLNYAERYKGLDILLQALQTIRQSWIDISLTIVGDGDDKSFYEKMIHTLGLDATVSFKGKLVGDALVEVFHESDIFVMPSTFESSPNVILEAMASGLPVVASNVGGIPDLVDDRETGFLFPVGRSDFLAGAIETLLAHLDVAQSMGQAGRKKVEEKYTWAKKAEETKEAIGLALVKQTDKRDQSSYSR